MPRLCDSTAFQRRRGMQAPSQHCRNWARDARAAECSARVTRLAIPLKIAAPQHAPSFYISFVF